MTPRQVERSYLLISGLYNLSASLIWGVNTLFLLNAGLDIFQVFIANGVFTASMMVFEIPTGVLADTRGRRASFLLSVIVILIGTLGYVWIAETTGSISGFVVMSVVLGLGYTFYTGAVDAWLVDALNATGYEGELDQVFARGGIVFAGSMLVGTLAGGLLGTLDLSLPYLVRSAMLAGVFVLAWFTMHDIGYTPHKGGWRKLPEEMGKIASASLAHGWKSIGVRLLMIVGLIQALFMDWSYHSWQPYFLGMLGREDAVWVAGIIAALIALSSMLGSALVVRFSNKNRRRTTLMLVGAIILGMGGIATGLADSFWAAVPIYLMVGIVFGLLGPVKQAYLHQLIPSEHRATVVSFDSLMRSGGAVGGQLGLGFLARQQSLSVGYIVGGIVSLLALPVLLILRRLGQSADRTGTESPAEE